MFFLCALCVFCGGLFLTGCVRAAPPTPQAVEHFPFILVTEVKNATPSSTPFSPSTITASPTRTQTPIPTSTEAPSPTKPTLSIGESRPQYSLIAELDYDARTLNVEERIIYTNKTGIPLDSLILVVEQNRIKNCFVLESIRLNRFKVTPKLDGAQMEIPLGTRLAVNESITIEIAYKLNIPPKPHEDVFGYLSGYQINIVDWYPFVAPYTHLDGWILHEPSGVGEHLVYEASDFDVQLKLIGEDDLVVAASAEGVSSGSATTRYQLKEARTFVFSVSSILNSQTEASGKASVTSFYYPDYDKAGKGILEAASQAIDIYSDRFAPYPYEHLSIVQTHLPDGMEYDGLIFMGSEFYDEYDGTMKNNLISIGVHEVSHQWWFGLVGSDHALEPWLDEAMALYSERIYYETVYPFPVNWWWRFRVTWFSPSGWVDTTIYNGYAFRGYTDAVYLRGAQFLEELRVRVGEKAFNIFLKDYASTYAGKIATSDDFFMVLDRNTDVDYSDIVDAYFLER
ncbi:MAG: M1 family metallopeptidase [Anaerolineae bacterium]|nr:M1 family metallopeptidase [Anaerolineae bacterium]MBT4310492.1 M1 family metallopeptidase [Anaerolineae bacterium]MBT4459414.1 M1 family metallopeptidase [Anaerolineae bacterium]MBT6061032.1 M1 family metallopeptidase [Anaerolineae bacterium]MBT6320886.1 M1 family metallopeptidase [Anaerolineae bacterium]